MTQIEKQIVEFLKQGLSYKQIQGSLHVSAKTIASVKRTHFPSTNSNANVPYRDPSVSGANSLSIERVGEINNFVKKTNEIDEFTPSKQRDQKSDMDNKDEKEADFKNETLNSRIKLHAEFDISRIIAESEARKLELLELKQEFSLMKEEISSFKNAESEKQIIIDRTKKVVDFCDDKEYSYEEIDNLWTEVNITFNDCEEYCKKHNINPFNSECYSILHRLVINIPDYHQKFLPNENGKMKCGFRWIIQDLKKRISYQKI